MFYQIAYYVILGLPVIAWGGILTLVSMLMTATLGYLFYTGKVRFPFYWHPTMAITTITLALLHGTVGILALLGF
jgi:hypothetical protein